MKKNLLIIGAIPPPIHGAAIYFENISKSKILNSRYNIKLFNARFNKNLEELETFTLSKYLLALKYSCQLVYLLLTSKIDIVFTQISYSNSGFFKDSFFIQIAKLFRKKVVSTILVSGQAEKYYAHGKIYRWWLYRTFKNSDVIMAHTKNIIERDWIEKIKKLNYVIIPYATKPLFTKQEAIKNLDIKDEKNITIIFMSNFYETKGIFDALKAAVSVVNTNPDILFKFAGNWTNSIDKAKAVLILKELKYPEQIQFVGYITDDIKKKYLLKADIFILPTFYAKEDMPLAILDSMSAGIAIVTTEQGGIAEVVKENVNGLFCKKQDATDLTEKLIYLINNISILRKMQKLNIDDYFSKYAYSNYENRIEEIFESLN